MLCAVCYLGGLWVLQKMDRAWILVRRGSGRDQKSGVLNRLVAVSSIVGASLFTIWLLLFSGAELAPVGIRF
jgi:hypothetical protein